MIEMTATQNHIVFIEEWTQSRTNGFMLRIKVFYKGRGSSTVNVAFSPDKDKLESFIPMVQALLNHITSQTEQPS